MRKQVGRERGKERRARKRRYGCSPLYSEWNWLGRKTEQEVDCLDGDGWALIIAALLGPDVTSPSG
jgi:hypothetical protein